METTMHSIYCCATMSLPATWNILGLHVKFSIFFSGFNQIWIFQQIFVTVTNTRFHRNFSTRSHADIRGQMDMMTPADAFCDYANALNEWFITQMCLWLNKYLILWASVYILALVVQYAKRIFSAPYYGVICDMSGRTIFCTLSHTHHDFRKKIKKTIENEMCVLNFSKPSVWNISLSKKSWRIYYHKFT